MALMATVTNTVTLPDGSVPAGVSVSIELIASVNGGGGAGWVNASDAMVLARAYPAVVAGEWSVDLTPNAAIDPSGTVYRVVETIGRHSAVHYIEVGDGGGNLHDLLAEAPTALTPQWLTTHNADTANVHGIADTSALVTTTTLPELARDAIGTALTGGTGIDITVSDAEDSIIIAAELGNANTPLVFEQPGVAGRSVYCGKFWPTSTDLPRFFWEAWICPLVSGAGGYWISEGYGGAHAILCGPMNGNIWDGTSLHSITADYSPQVGEWIHSAMSWDGTHLRQYTNGVVVAILSFAGPRRAQQGGLYLGGSDHSNLQGRIAGVRGWEGADEDTSPVPYFGSSLGFGFPFGPSRSFVDFCPRLPDGAPASFVMDFTARAFGALADLSGGYGGKRHPGMLIGANWNDGNVLREYRPSGLWVADLTCPLRTDADVRPVRTLPAAPSTPGGAKIFDSFSRADSLLAWENPTLGNTEAGSLGVKTWAGDTGAFGIFDGRAVEQSHGGYPTARVSNDSADMDVRVDRRVVDGLHHTGMCLRASSGSSMVRLHTTGTLTGGSVTLSNGGPFDGIASYPAPGSWTTLRVVALGTTITVYTGTGGSWSQIGQATGVTLNQAAVGVGLYSHYAPDTAKRWDNFTVF